MAFQSQASLGCCLMLLPLHKLTPLPRKPWQRPARQALAQAATPKHARPALAQTCQASLGTSCCPMQTCARQALAAVLGVQLLQPLGKGLPHLLGVLHLEGVSNIMPAPYSLHKPGLGLAKLHLGIAIHQWCPAGAWVDYGRGTSHAGG